MPDRDPRFDPRPGDGLRGPRGGLQYVEDTRTTPVRLEGGRTYEQLDHVRAHDGRGRSRWVTAAQWREWSADAEVVRRAEDVQR